MKARQHRAVKLNAKQPREPNDSVVAGSANVFADLGLPNADELLAKAKLAQEICAIVNSRKWTQSRAAEMLGIDQPRISALLRGKLDEFSTDCLRRFLNTLPQIAKHESP